MVQPRLRGVGVVLLATLLAAPAVQATHMGDYYHEPLEHDLQGQIPEPDGVSSSVLGPLLGNCVVALPVAGSFTGRCSTAHQATGTGRQPAGTIAPGCTGETASGQMVRRMDGQCGLWTVGAHPLGVRPPVVGAQLDGQKVPEPASEKGLGPASRMPGRYDGPVRILDGRVDSDAVQFPFFINNVVPGAGTQVRDYGALLSDLQRGGMQPIEQGGVTVVAPAIPDVALVNSRAAANAIVPTKNFVWAWYGDWSDLNRNGVLDHCWFTCRGTANEFTWLGSCTGLDNVGNLIRNPDAILDGICAEDPNPHSDPPGQPCPEPDSASACAFTEIAFWIWPGNHHGTGFANPPVGSGDYPGRQVVTWATSQGMVTTAPVAVRPQAIDALNCSDNRPTCDEVDRDLYGDPLLGRQDELTPDGTMHDRTGDGGNGANQDVTRQWAGYLGGDSIYYGDDGLLVTLVEVFGVNCARSTLPQLRNLHALPGSPGGCAFLDVDRQVTILPQAQDQLVGADCNGSTPEPECPTQGLKGNARTQWKVVRDGTPGLPKLATSLALGNGAYQATAGPFQGAVHDQLANNGWSREPNLGSATYQDKAGVTRTVAEQYVGVAHTACEDAALFPVGDTRNPTAAHDPESDEARHRGFCNVHVGGAPQPAYRDYALSTTTTPAGPQQIGRGWIDLQAVRGVTTSSACCPSTGLAFTPELNAPVDPETPHGGIRDPTDHRRTLGPGRYAFVGHVGLWADRPYRQDESLFPQTHGTVTSQYPPAADSFPLGDGWVGTAARAGGQWHYRSFAPGVCPDYATDKDRGNASGLKGSHDAAECNPYKDGNVDDPEDYTLVADGGEWQPACDPATVGPIHVAPEDGELDTQILTATDVATDSVPRFVFGTYGPGKVDPLAIPVACASGADLFEPGVLRGRTLLYWASGGMFDSVVTWVEARVNITLPGSAGVLGVDQVRDVDHYPALALAAEPPASSWPVVPPSAVALLNP